MHKLEKYCVLLCYKNFAAHQGISHIGLGVSAMNTAKVLGKVGVKAHVIPLAKEGDLAPALAAYPNATHVVVSAPWIATSTYSHLIRKHHQIQFAVNCHSNVGFLQADTNGIRLLAEDIELEMGHQNFHVAGNSERLVRWIEQGYGAPATYLPNLYYVNHLSNAHRHNWTQSRGVLRIGVFGATRGLKNMLSAVAAAVQIARELKCETEIWMNSERDDGPESGRIRQAVAELTRNLPSVSVKQAGWQGWPGFRKLVGSMHLLLQPSYTESFNMVTADGIAEGVPCVVGPAIDWVPRTWRADPDDVCEIARVGVGLIHDSHAVVEGMHALKRHNRKGVEAWVRYLSGAFGDDVDQFEELRL